ncbi:MAG: hypothetical protein HMLKMBBP_00223 [Planctomycetes bacterium]|nr:hypothetical protein [Planctomycetota bacterium]
MLLVGDEEAAPHVAAIGDAHCGSGTVPAGSAWHDRRKTHEAEVERHRSGDVFEFSRAVPAYTAARRSAPGSLYP